MSYRRLALAPANTSRAEAIPTVSAAREYPDRPFLAVSVAIVREGKLLLVRRSNPPAKGLWTLPGGVVEAGETLMETGAREVLEETGIVCEPVALIGHREAIGRDQAGKVKRHFVILPFAARYVSGEIKLNEELSEARWIAAGSLGDLQTTEGLAEIVDAAFARLKT
jgi:ADP-ribose pyrophosphatase YjhB (NUDIX family)